MVMTFSAFFDESGKFRDHKVISFGGVASFESDVANFAQEWGALLFREGLKELSVKTAFRFNVPLSKKNQDTGLENRINVLLPFIRCIRKHLLMVTGIALDVEAYSNLPPRFFELFTNDPIYMSFTWSLLKVSGFQQHSKISFICDEDEETALNFYHLYRRVKKKWPDARKKLAAISFASSEDLFGIQAADLISGITRLELLRKIKNVPYDYAPLFDALRKDPEPGERLWEAGVAIGGKESLEPLAQHILKEWKARKKENDKEEQRIRELRSHDVGPDRGSARAAKGRSRHGERRKTEESQR
jgi:Protein of unknown function (DUF3800)